MNAIRLSTSLAVMLTATTIISGCSNTRVIAENNYALESESLQYLLPAYSHSNKMINNISAIQVERMDEAWKAGPTFSQKFKALREGEDVENGWQPDVEHPSQELDALKKYREASEIALLFKPTDVSVLVDDKTTLIVMEHDWLWSEGYGYTNPKSKEYLQALSRILINTNGVISVKSFESPLQSLSNSQWIANKRALRVKNLLLESGYIRSNIISAYGVGYKQSNYNIDPRFSGRIEIAIYNREVDTNELHNET